MTHLDPERLGAYADGALAERERLDAARHLEGCAACREALAELQALEASLATALAHDPGEAYFERFAERVEDRIRAEVKRPAPLPEGTGGRFDLGAWFRSPRRLALVGAVATVIGGAAFVLIASRAPDSWLREPAETAVRGTAIEEAPQSAPATPPAADSRTEEGAGSTAPAPEATAMRAPAATTVAPRRGATSQRLQEVRRNEAGEDVPVNPQADAQFSREPAPAPAPSAPGEPVRVVKPQTAQPMSGTAETAQRSALNATAKEAAGGLALCGRVADGRGRPIAGAEVMLVERATLARTDADGRFCVSAPAGDYRLSVLAIGFRPTSTPVQVAANAPELQIVMPAISVLDGRSADGARLVTGGDAFASLSAGARALATTALQLSNAARANPSATAWDRAAIAWRRVVSQATREPAREAARYALAEARFEAWRAAPSAARADAADEAFASYLDVAPAGERRETVERWRAQVR